MEFPFGPVYFTPMMLFSPIHSILHFLVRKSNWLLDGICQLSPHNTYATSYWVLAMLCPISLHEVAEEPY